MSRRPAANTPKALKPKATPTQAPKQATAKKTRRYPARRSAPRDVNANTDISPTDVRLMSNEVSKAGTSKMIVQGTDRSVTVRCDMAGPGSSPLPLQSLALGIVLTSLSRGWTSNLAEDQKDFPYNAYVYLVQSFISAAQGNTSTLTVAPTWYWYILDAIAPTTVKYKTGSADFSWSFPVGPDYIPPPNVVANGGNVFLGWSQSQGVDVDGFYTIVPGVYDPLVASKAIQSLFTLYSEEGPMLKRVPQKQTPLVSDVSAFASVYNEMGGSALSPGGLATSLQSEVHIDCPILSKFAYYDYQTYRGVTFVGRSAGTPCYVIPRMIEFTSPRFLRNQVPPVFKFYNFDEFYEVLSLTLAKAMEITATNNAQQPVASCPLTPQAVQILLRQSILPRFCNHMTQDLTAEGDDVLRYYPFSVGTNGVSITMASVPMKLPQLLAENIRACGRRLTFLKNNDHQSDIIPILCRTSFSQLGNYVTASGVPVYTDIPEEVPINLIDLSAASQAGTVYVDANGGYIQSLASTFNEWISTLGSALSPLTNHAEEDGIRALSTIVNTLHMTLQPQEPNLPVATAGGKGLSKRPSVVSLGKKIDVVRRVGLSAAPVNSDTWTTRVCSTAFTSTYAPKTPVYKYLKLMILPSIILSGDKQANNIDVQQVNQIEPFRINFSTVSEDYQNTSRMTMLERHALFASQEIRTNLAPTTEFQTELDQLTRSGRGGFFTDIAGMIGGDLLHIPGAKEITSMIGQLTGL